MKNHFILVDTESGITDAIIVTPATKEEIAESIFRAKQKGNDYTWEDLIAEMPSDTQVIDCFGLENRVYY